MSAGTFNTAHTYYDKADGGGRIVNPVLAYRVGLRLSPTVLFYLKLSTLKQ